MKSNKLPERRRRSIGIQWAIVIIAAIPTTLASVGALVVTIKNGADVKVVKAQVSAVAAAVDAKEPTP